MYIYKMSIIPIIEIRKNISAYSDSNRQNFLIFYISRFLSASSFQPHSSFIRDFQPPGPSPKVFSQNILTQSLDFHYVSFHC